MSGKKKLKVSDIIMDCIIGGVALVLLIVLLRKKGDTPKGENRRNESDGKLKGTH